MNCYESQTEEELQSNIEAQEQALIGLLNRVMQSPLTSLYTVLDDLRNQLDAVKDANSKDLRGIEAIVSCDLEAMKGSIKSGLSHVEDDIDELKENLAELAAALQGHQASQAERDQGLVSRLTKTSDHLAVLDAKTDSTGTALVGIAHEVAKLDLALRALREQEQAGTERLNRSLFDLGQQLERQRTDVDARLDETGTLLAQLDTKADAAIKTASATAHRIDRIGAELGALREQEHADSGLLNRGLGGLAQQLEHHQTHLAERIDGVQPALASRFEALAETIGESSKAVGHSYAALSAAQQELITTTVREQFALQLAPLQIRARWLVVVCGASLASMLGLLSILLLR
ncbi:MAG TPA: hypothetical protein VJ654_11260 [Noviherbaspirillum sp.]|nr:hypothetical protein [Noviherbaspirillum sp.]